MTVTKNDAEPPRTSAKLWAAKQAEQDQKRKENINARRLASRARNKKSRPPLPPGGVKPARFYVSPRVQRTWFPDERHWWGACYLLNLLHWKWLAKWKWVRNAELNGHVPLLHRFLKKIVPQTVLKQTKQTLIDRGVIGCDRTAVIGCKAYGYLLLPDYRKTELLFCADDKLNLKIWEAQAEVEGARRPLLSWLLSRLQLLKIDSKQAAVIIASLHPKRKQRKRPESREDYHLSLTEHVQQIANGEHRLHCDAYGRVHTLAVNLKRELRHLLTVDDQSLVSIDLSCSQPLMIAVLTMSYLNKSKMAMYRLTNMKHDQDKDPYNALNQALVNNPKRTNTNTPSIYMPITKLRPPKTPIKQGVCAEGGPLRPMPADLQEFLHVCQDGTLYEVMSRPGESVKWNKRRLLSAFYARPGGKRCGGVIRCNQMWLRFAERFPTAARFLLDLKVKDYRRAAWVVQNFEATMVLGNVCGRIMREQPDAVIVTVHDCLMTTPDCVPYVTRVIREEYAKIGVNPKLKVQ